MTRKKERKWWHRREWIIEEKKSYFSIIYETLILYENGLGTLYDNRLCRLYEINGDLFLNSSLIFPGI